LERGTMEIGGKDLWCENGTDAQWEAALAYFKRIWPNSVIEVMDDHLVADDDLFIYESQETWDRLETEGITDELEPLFANFIRNKGRGFTIVVSVDFDSSELERIIADYKT
jgi:hypothetical protein